MKEAKEQITSVWKALYFLTRPTWMLALAQLCLATLPLISFLVMVHTGYLNLIATGTGIVFVNFTGLSVMLALGIACEELSLSKSTFEDAVITLQKGLYMCLLVIPFFSWALWMNAGTFLVFFGFQSSLAGLIEDFSFCFLPGLLLFVVCVFLQKYMYIVNLENNLPSLFCSFVAAVFHAIISWIFMSVFKLGVRGAAYAMNLSYLFLSVLLFLSLMWRAEYRTSWPGWSWECVKDHWTYAKKIIPYIVVVALEWWTFDLGTIIIGAMNEKHLPTQLVIVLLLECLCLMTHQFALAATAQVEDAVKGGFWKRAVFILRCAMLLTWVFSIFCGALLSGLKTYFKPIFTEQWRFEMTTGEIIILIAPIPFLRGTQALGFHTLRRFDKKVLPVIIAGVGYWGISLPAALTLVCYGRKGVKGFWIGYMFGALFQALAFLMLVYHKMRKWMDKEEMYEAGKAPGTPSGQMDVDPFTGGDAVDGKKRNSINIRHPIIHVPFNLTETTTVRGTSTSGEAADIDPRPSLKILLIRTFVFMVAVCVFVMGIYVRFFVPSAHKGHEHDF